MQPTAIVGYLGGGFAVALASASLAGRRSAAPSARLLSLLLAIAGLTMLAITADHQLGGAVATATIEVALALSVGPALLAFVTASVDDAFEMQRSHLLHLTPAMLATAASALGLRVVPDHWFIAFQLPYTVAAFARYRESEAKGTPWVTPVLGTMAVVHIAQIARTIGGSHLRDAVPLALTATVLTIAAMAWRQATATARKYERSSLSEAQAMRVLEQLDRAFVTDKIYSDRDLTLAKAARVVGVSAQALSQAINQYRGTTFGELLTSHRLEHARAELTSPELSGLKVDVVALRAGFPSRSSFYDAFRRAFGVTPSSYRAESFADRVRDDRGGHGERHSDG